MTLGVFVGTPASLPGLRPPPPPPAGRRDRAPVVILAVLIPALVAGLVWAMYTGASPEGGLATPSACSLLDQDQVGAYLPGAVADGGGYQCSWTEPGRAGERLTASVEALPGDPPSVEDAEEEYDLRRRQADAPGTTITPLKIGDETFMACAAPPDGGPGSCTAYTRVRNVVFSLTFESLAVTGARDPASSVRALDAEAALRLGGSGG
ncbi:hypothetical protein [Actinoallomurus sp. CA-142502]|uniref:hypothetical protein n=1 Tax=Actinoallomurus sp. CA-142502 TaxID=3239885 RepID=UPI003D90F682